MENEIKVIIVGAGPSGLAISACLNKQNIPNIVLEKEDCCGSLFKKRAYDRLKLHLAKEFCALPYMPFPPNSPTFVPKHSFIQYLDDYALKFNVNPLYGRNVQCCSFDQSRGKWVTVAKNDTSTDVFVSKFLVVASGENSEGYIPPIDGLETFKGQVLHSSQYENGHMYNDKKVLVVGSGNSGMEIAYDLSNCGASTSLLVRSPVHILSERMVYLGMVLLKYMPLTFVDNIMLLLSKLKYGKFSGYGIQRPDKGPFFLKRVTGRSPVIDVGTMGKIRSREIKVFPSIKNVSKETINFINGEQGNFDAVVFATGYKSTVQKWIKDVDGELFNKDGMPNNKYPNHWKGQNGLYCVGFARAGLFGISADAISVAEDISAVMLSCQN